MFNKKTLEENMNIKSNINSILIHVNELGPSLVPKLIMECSNAEYWHKFVVENVETYGRDFLLRTIMDFVQPADIMPVNFERKEKACFLARNCLDAILKLTSSKLVVPNPLSADAPLKLTIIANHCPARQLKYNYENDIINVLKKRFAPGNKVLYLNEFHKNEELKDFFPLSQPKLLFYVLQLAKDMPFQHLALAKNCIKVITPIHVLTGHKITSINLTDNEIAHMEDLEVLKNFRDLKKLQLSGNPLCQGWRNPDDYANKVRVMLPNLFSLDKTGLKFKNIPKLKHSDKISKNFMCSAAGKNLVSQFLEHFFMVYDSDNRQDIAPLYHESAMFSVTHRVIPSQKTTWNVQLSHYQRIDRNLVSNDPLQFLFCGREAIMNVFASLPRSDHDPCGFHCDLMYYVDDQAVLVVNGLFRENKQYIGFTRHFALKCEDNAYSITNDQLHVFNGLNQQVKNSDFPPIPIEISGIPIPYSAEQYTQLQLTVHKITNLNYDYSQRYLEACHYELKKTLETFIDMYLKDEVPPEAFIQIGKEGLLSQRNPKTPYPPYLIAKTHSKHPVIAPKTIYQTLKDDRLASRHEIANNDAALDAEAERIKKKILRDRPNNTGPTQGFIQTKETTKPIWHHQVFDSARNKQDETPHGTSNRQTNGSDPFLQPDGTALKTRSENGTRRYRLKKGLPLRERLAAVEQGMC